MILLKILKKNHNIKDYQLEDNILKFVISGDEGTINKYKKIAKKYDVKCKFEG